MAALVRVPSFATWVRGINEGKEVRVTTERE
jgi:hypothetical protein